MPSAIDPALLALQPQSLGSLRHAAKHDPEGSMRQVAQQFESLFVGIMLKSMRSATPGNSLFDNEQSRLYAELRDQQVAQKIATTGKGLGLADMLLTQMKRNAGVAPEAKDGSSISLLRETAAIPLKRDATPIPLKSTLPGSDLMPLVNKAPGNASATPKEFVANLWPHAAQAARDLGIAPHVLVAQAALESGWGKREIRLADGGPSHNLLGIKAGPEWQGKVAETLTTEYANGVAQSQVARFRAYDSYEEALRDYVNLLKSSPRYTHALQATDSTQFAQALQRGGYATDPAYAAKLGRIMASETMRQALAT